MRSSVSSVGLVGLLALALAGCSSAGQPATSATASSSDCTVTAAGTASDAVSVTGDISTHPTATFETPLSVESTQRSVLIEGDGDLITPGAVAVADVTIYNGDSGAELFSTTTEGGVPWELPVESGNLIDGLYDTLQCSTVGSRLAAVVPPEDAFGTTAQAQLGLTGTEAVVFVLDVREVKAPTPVLTTDQTRATGAPQDPPAGLPTVTLAEDGAPTVTIPDSEPPAELTIAALKKGDGPIVEVGQEVIVQYQGVNWRSKTVFDQSWGKGAVTMDPARTISGFASAIVGQTVGSQVLVIIPPNEGYGPSGNQGAGIEGTDTIVFVIDILAAG